MGSNDRVSIADIDSPEEWIDLTAKVVTLWEADSDAVAQVGLLGDGPIEVAVSLLGQYLGRDSSRVSRRHPVPTDIRFLIVIIAIVFVTSSREQGLRELTSTNCDTPAVKSPDNHYQSASSGSVSSAGGTGA